MGIFDDSDNPRNLFRYNSASNQAAQRGLVSRFQYQSTRTGEFRDIDEEFLETHRIINPDESRLLREQLRQILLEVLNVDPSIRPDVSDVENVRILIADKDEVNALAVVEQSLIVFNKGLLEKIKYKEEIQSVTFHELAHILAGKKLKKPENLQGRASEDSSDMIATLWALDCHANFAKIEALFLEGGLLYDGSLQVGKNIAEKHFSSHGRSEDRIKRLNTAKGIWLNRISHAVGNGKAPTPWQANQLDDLKYVSFYEAFQNHLRPHLAEADIPAAIFDLDMLEALRTTSRFDEAAKLLINIDRNRNRPKSMAWLDTLESYDPWSGGAAASRFRFWKTFMYKTFYHVLLSDKEALIFEPYRESYKKGEHLREPELYSLPATPALQPFVDAINGFIGARNFHEAYTCAVRLQSLRRRAPNPIVQFQRLAVRRFNSETEDGKVGWHAHLEWADQDPSGRILEALYRLGPGIIDLAIFDRYPLSHIGWRTNNDSFGMAFPQVLLLPEDRQRDFLAGYESESQHKMSRGDSGLWGHPVYNTYEWDEEKDLPGQNHHPNVFTKVPKGQFGYSRNGNELIRFSQYLLMRFDRERGQGLFRNSNDPQLTFHIWQRLLFDVNGRKEDRKKLNQSRSTLFHEYIREAKRVFDVSGDRQRARAFFFQRDDQLIWLHENRTSDIIYNYIMRDPHGIFSTADKMAVMQKLQEKRMARTVENIEKLCARYRTILDYEAPQNIFDIDRLASEWGLPSHWYEYSDHGEANAHVGVIGAEHELLIKKYIDRNDYTAFPVLCSYYCDNKISFPYKWSGAANTYIEKSFEQSDEVILKTLQSANAHDCLNTFMVGQGGGFLQTEHLRASAALIVMDKINGLRSKKDAVDSCLQILNMGREDGDKKSKHPSIKIAINHFELEQFAITKIAQFIVDDIGEDNGRASYMRHFLPGRKYDALVSVNPRIRRDLLWKVADAIVSQRELSSYFAQSISIEQLEDWSFKSSVIAHLSIGLGDYISDRLRSNKEIKKHFLEFLLTPISKETVKDFCTKAKLNAQKYYEKAGYKKSEANELFEQELLEFHSRFWNAPADVRTLALDNILLSGQEVAEDAAFRSARTETTGEHPPLTANETSALRLATNLLLPLNIGLPPEERQKYEASRHYIGCYLEASDPSERTLAISNLLAAAPRGKGEQMEHADIVANTLSYQGPAMKKLGQRVVTSPDVAPDYRRALQHFRTNVEPWPRWTIFQRIDEVVPHNLRNKITYVGPYVGAASLWVTVPITMRGNTQKALGLLRPKARAHANFGFDRLRRATQIYARRYPRYRKHVESLAPLIEQGHDLTLRETDTRYGHEQSVVQAEICDGVIIQLPSGKDIRFATMNWERYGKEYKLMPLATGPHFIDMKSEQQIHETAFAVAYVGFQRILSGKPFDGDWHGGQCKREGDLIQVFDPGGIDLRVPVEEDKKLLGKEIAKAIASGNYEQIFESLLNPPPDLLKNNYISRVREGLWAISDFTSRLSKTDMFEIFVSIYRDEATPMDAVIKSEIDNALNGVRTMVMTFPSRAVRKTAPAGTALG